MGKKLTLPGFVYWKLLQDNAAYIYFTYIRTSSSF